MRFGVGKCEVMHLVEDSATNEAVSSVRTQERNLSTAEKEEESVCCCGQTPTCMIRKVT